MNTKMIAIPALLLSMTFSPVMYAHSMEESSHSSSVMQRHTHFSGLMMQKMTTKLGLSTEQQTKIKAIKEHSRAMMKPKLHELKLVRHQLHALTRSSKMNESKLDALIHQKTEIIGSITKIRVMAEHRIYQLLTPAQKVKFDGMVKEWKARHMNHQHA